MASQTDLIIAVMGATGTGKSTFINLVSGSHFAVGEGQLSCTPSVQSSAPFDFNGRKVTLIDTPGFDDSTKSDTEILKLIATYLETSYRNNKKLSGVIYMHRISDFKMSGISRRNFRMFRTLCGDATLKNIAIVTNMWGEVSEEVGVKREKELASNDLLFKPVLDKGSVMMRHRNTLESAHAILRHFLTNHPITLQIQAEMAVEHKPLEATSAAAEIDKEVREKLEEERRQHEERVRREKEEADRRIRAEQERVQAQIREAQRAMEAERERQRQAHEAELRRLEAERQQREQRQRELERQQEEARRERERVEAEARAAHERAVAQQEAERRERERLEQEFQRVRDAHRRHKGNDCIIM
ncbi:P-loop containing nucleoside triphosphate hydrolase protein [Abortiporus biennis]|nr:P-loop containing nucleoside triphosphate hydrolase protein [Abortiporus biennis]